jgi:glycosyltransferase involved in cell wall biosynthesis
MTNGSKRRQYLNILCVGTLPPHPGGSAIFFHQLLIEFIQMGHRVRALAPITSEVLRSGDQLAVTHPEIRVSRFLVPHFDVAPPHPALPEHREYREVERAQLQATLPLLISSDRPDVILIGRESFALDVPEIARTHHVPSVMLIRGGSRTARLLSGGYPDDLARRLLEEYRKANLIVAVARHLAEGLRRLGLDDVRMIPNAVNLHRFFPKPKDVSLLRELVIREDDVVVMHVANLQARKRSVDLVLSARLALQKNPRLMYVIVGDGPFRQTMEQTCRDRHISDRFRYVGWIDYDRIPDYINLADLMVMPSEAEGLSRVYLETQACGRVLVASDIPPAREVIVDGETGLLFRVGDIDGLTAKTLIAARDPALRAAIGQNAQEQMKAYSLDHIAAAYSTVLQNVVRQHGR